MKSFRLLSVIAGLASVLAISLASCSSDNTSPDRPDVLDADGDGGQPSDGPILCQTDDQCPDGQTCQSGVCVDAGQCECNYDCQKGQICNRATHRCEPGAAANCVDDCDCYSGETCVQGKCRPSGGDEIPCQNDGDCPSGQTCQNEKCVPTNCSTREDCAGATCLVCDNGQCVAPPPVCQGLEDCCVGYYCNFGTCVPESTDECLSDNDCTDPDFPRCVDGKCIQECVNDIDCPNPGEVCQDNHCITPGCQPESCPQGQWCDTGDGQCKPGCDENADCTPPETCNYVTHQCGQTDCCGGCPSTHYCDTLTCQCVEKCSSNLDCPTGYECKPDGTCWCTTGSCPPNTHCNTSTGQCEQDTTSCTSSADCPTGWTCNTMTGQCEPPSGLGQEGDFCLQDSQCDQNAGLLCDSSIFCIGCMLTDPNFNPTFTCRYECSCLIPTCSNPNQQCLYRHLGFKCLCVEPTTGP